MPQMTMNLLQLSCAGSALLCVLPAQNLLLPDNHHLVESQAQVYASGSTSWWGSTASVVGRRFQVLYDASHFTGVGGVTGPIRITHVAFRGEDTEHNTGGQVFTTVVATLYSTSLTSAAALNTTFAINIAAATSTPLGTVAIPALTAAPSVGRAPNNYILDLDFSNVPMVPFDPTIATQPNLLLDVTYATQTVAPAPELSEMIQIQDTAGTTAFIRGRGLFAASALALVGTGSTIPPVMLIRFISPGPGGYPSLIPARNERYGGACGGNTSTFYQLFAHGEYFDLKDPGQVDLASGLRLNPNAYPGPSFYFVSGGAAPVDLLHGVVGVPISVNDDETVPFPIPPFQYPGGPAAGTPVIRPSTNGYVILDPASTEISGDYNPTLAKWLGTPATNLARVAPFWHDFSPNKNTIIDPTSGLYAVINAVNPAEVLITWNRVGRFNSVAQQGQEYHTMQCSLNTATGVIEFRYGPMDQIWGDTFTASTVTGGTSGITGFTRGAIGGVPSQDPQSRDLSIERPFRTQVEGATGHMGNTVVAAPVLPGPVYMGRAFFGQTLKWNASNVPAGSLLGVQLIDIAAARPGIMAAFLTAPGCMLSVTPGAILWELTVFPPASVTGTVGFTIPVGWPGFLGFDLYAQYVVLDGLFIPGPLITVASNAVHTTVGLQ